MKKILSVISAVALLGIAVLALPASTFATNSYRCGVRRSHVSVKGWNWGGHNDHHSNNHGGDGNVTTINQDNDSINVNVKNDATVNSYTAAYAVSGGNVQHHNDDNNSMSVGSSNAAAWSQNVVNTTSVHIDQD